MAPQESADGGVRFWDGSFQDRPSDVAAIGEWCLVVGIGLAIGTALGLGLGSLMSGILFGVEPADTPTMTAVMGAIGLTAILASIAPLRHAVRVSPAETLRAE